MRSVGVGVRAELAGDYEVLAANVYRAGVTFQRTVPLMRLPPAIALPPRQAQRSLAELRGAVLVSRYVHLGNPPNACAAHSATGSIWSLAEAMAARPN